MGLVHGFLRLAALTDKKSLFERLGNNSWSLLAMAAARQKVAKQSRMNKPDQPTPTENFTPRQTIPYICCHLAAALTLPTHAGSVAKRDSKFGVTNTSGGCRSGTKMAAQFVSG